MWVSVQLAQVIEKYKITAKNIYNFDKKGFLMGFGRSLKRIITREALESGQTTKAQQDRNREFISILVCILVVRRWITLLLIYKGDLGDLTDTQVDRVIHKSRAHFTTSHNGQSNREIRLKWLQQVFQCYTKPTQKTRKYLLIVNGHSSHVNYAFINYYDLHGIIVLILPPHTTHWL